MSGSESWDINCLDEVLEGMRRFFYAAPWLMFWCAFFAFGLWLNSQWPDGVARFQVHGYDYSDYMWFLSDWHEIFYPRPRHPLFGVLFFPMAVACGWLNGISHNLCFWAISAFFSGIMVACSFLVAKIAKGGISAAILYGSFSSTIILGGMPESFGISALICLLVLKWSGEGKFEGHRYIATSIIAGGVTVTQGIKLLLIRFVAGRGSLKERLKGIVVACLWCAGAAFAIGLLFIVVYLLRKWLNPEYSRTLADMFCDLGAEFSYGDMSWGQRLNRWWVFVSEPILTRGTALDDVGITMGYSSFWHALLLVPMYVISAIGAWVARRDTIVKAILMCLAVDFGIHFIFGWGMREPHLYAGHWTFALPIFVFFAIQRLKTLVHQRICGGLVAAYGVGLACLNIRAFGVI